MFFVMFYFPCVILSFKIEVITNAIVSNLEKAWNIEYLKYDSLKCLCYNFQKLFKNCGDLDLHFFKKSVNLEKWYTS